MDTCHILKKIWKINSFSLCGNLRKTIFDLEPAKHTLKCDVSEVKDQLF